MWIIQSKYQDSNFYGSLEKEIFSLIGGEKNLIANLANISSWIYHTIPDLNWCGFYLWSEDDKELILGPFQGKPACIRIKSGKGVCGSSFANNETLKVDNVHEFPGHIACDSASLSELVIPLRKNGKVFGVLDLDSPSINRFSQKDLTELEKILNLVSQEIF
jgi:L-methionine (R)-S-oxide reductase